MRASVIRSVVFYRYPVPTASGALWLLLLLAATPVICPGPSRAADAGSVGPGPAAERHWAFQPIRRPTLPRVGDGAWVRTPVDAFVQARLTEAGGLTVSPPASRSVLLRRLYLDLIGLPPTPLEVDAFQADTRPD